MSPKTSNLPNRSGATPDAVATWMLEELEKQNGVLYQEDAATQIADLFGEQFVYDNDRGNSSINKEVLSVFRKLTAHSVVWIRGERLWRRREVGDEVTRQQE
jgi:hypothetical protein